MVDVRNENRPEVLKQIVVLQEREIERLHARVRAQAERIAQLSGDPGEVQRELIKLQELLARREQALFGPSSERRGNKDKDHDRPRTPQKGHGPKPQPALPVVEAVWELDEADKQCTTCGGGLDVWEGQFEESEEIDVIERQFVMKKHKRQKYRCKCGGCVETALGPKKLRPGNRYSVDFAIEVAASKYLDHMPLERQVRMMRREGLDVDSQTLWDQLEALAALGVIARLPEEFLRAALSHRCVGMDETRWAMLDGKKEKPTRWYVWSVSSPIAIVHRIFDTRAHTAAKELLGDYDGVVMTDGYAAYETAKNSGGRFSQAHCWGHVRREFLVAEESYPREAKAVLDLIDELFAIEREVPETGPPDTGARLVLVAEIRNERSRWVVRALESWVMEISRTALPESSLGKAAAYLAKLWAGLVVFLDNPNVPLSNNATERGIRGVVVGRKNHYGSKSKRGTEVAALFYSIFETAKLCGVEPKAYLRRAVHAALDGERVLLPHEVAAEAVTPKP